MADQHQLERLLRSYQWGTGEENELADDLYEFKVAAYIDTLLDLALLHGYDVDVDENGDIDLPQHVLDALQREAEGVARKMVHTHNREVAAFIERNKDRGLFDLQDMIEDWEEDRARTKAQVVSVTEVYRPHADATIAFYMLAGVEPDFDFGGHGDAEPVCALCKALVENSPHPMARVVEVGSPHPGCRQTWHARIDPDDLPDDLDFGDLEIGGMVGGASLVDRVGSIEAAAEIVERD
jgi:hypothetical protein